MIKTRKEYNSMCISVCWKTRLCSVAVCKHLHVTKRHATLKSHRRLHRGQMVRRSVNRWFYSKYCLIRHEKCIGNYSKWPNKKPFMCSLWIITKPIVANMEWFFLFLGIGLLVYGVDWWTIHHSSIYSISQEICTQFCCALLCCGYAIVHNEFTWSIYSYSSGLLCWHWGNR